MHVRFGLARDESGSTVVEFAIISVPFLALVLFCLQVGMVFFAEQGLQTFNEDVSRNILTGATQKLSLSQTDFKNAVCTSLPNLYSCSRLFVDVQATNAFSSADATMPALTYDGSGNVTNTWNYNLGGPGDVMVVRMIYLWPVVGTVIGPGLGNTAGGNREILATSVFKNEQFQ